MCHGGVNEETYVVYGVVPRNIGIEYLPYLLRRQVGLESFGSQYGHDQVNIFHRSLASYLVLRGLISITESF